MAGSIGPMEAGVQGPRRRAAVHFFGSIIGGAVLGLFLAAIAGATLSVPYQLRVSLALGGIAVLGIWQIIYPKWTIGSKRQVPRTWREIFGPQGALFLYGLKLSLGFLTPTPSYVYWSLPLISILLSPSTALVLGLTFGLARAVIAIVIAGRIRDPHAAIRVLGHRALLKSLSVAILGFALVSSTLLSGRAMSI